MKRETAVESSAVRKQVSAVEWQMRVELAACYRLVDLYGWTDLIATHISGRVPGEPGHFLINPYGMGFGEITASSLLKLDEEGNVLLPSEHPCYLPPSVAPKHAACRVGRGRLGD